MCKLICLRCSFFQNQRLADDALKHRQEPPECKKICFEKSSYHKFIAENGLPRVEACPYPFNAFSAQEKSAFKNCQPSDKIWKSLRDEKMVGSSFEYFSPCFLYKLSHTYNVPVGSRIFSLGCSAEWKLWVAQVVAVHQSWHCKRAKNCRSQIKDEKNGGVTLWYRRSWRSRLKSRNLTQTHMLLLD